MLRRVRIKGYKSLRDVEVRFDKPLSVIIGANAAGKSNLFDVLALLSRMVTKRTLGEAFEAHRGSPLEAFSYIADGTPGSRKKTAPTCSIEVEFDVSSSTIAEYERDLPKASNGTPRFGLDTRAMSEQGATLSVSYDLSIRLNSRTGALSLTQERLIVSYRTPQALPSERLRIERAGDILTVKSTDTPDSGTYNAAPYATLFTIVPVLLPSILAFPVYLEMSRWRFYLLEADAMRQPTPLNDVTALARNGANLAAYINTLKMTRPKQFESVGRALHTFIPALERLDVETDPNGYLYLIVRENDIDYSSRLISDGTLRILGLLAATHPLEPVSLIGIEEPENGVHPRRLELIASVLASAVEDTGRQILVNTHSALLPGYLPDAQVIACRRDDSGTVFETLPDSVRSLGEAEDEVAPNGNEEWLPPTTLFERILRGDYGG